MSVIDFVDEIMVWDTGSTDRTVEIIHTINSPKIKFLAVESVDPVRFTEVSQKMLSQSQSGWLFLLDGDEIWPDKAVKEITGLIRKNGSKYDYLISPYFNLLGDVFHYQEPKAGQYILGKHVGNFSIRAVNLSIPGLHFDRPHGQRGLFDSQNILIQDRQSSRYTLVKEPYLHSTHLLRSASRRFDKLVPKRWQKYKYELGIGFPEDFQFPRVFYLPRPSMVPSPWTRRGALYMANALWQTPLKMIRRRVVNLPSGY